jgi:hypothetical protein
LSKVFLAAVAPLLLNYPQHKEDIEDVVDFIILADHVSHSVSTLKYHKVFLDKFDKSGISTPTIE